MSWRWNKKQDKKPPAKKIQEVCYPISGHYAVFHRNAECEPNVSLHRWSETSIQDPTLEPNEYVSPPQFLVFEPDSLFSEKKR